MLTRAIGVRRLNGNRYCSNAEAQSATYVDFTTPATTCVFLGSSCAYQAPMGPPNTAYPLEQQPLAPEAASRQGTEIRLCPTAKKPHAEGGWVSFSTTCLLQDFPETVTKGKELDA